jgi:chromosomal replication initiation ATPase DnaA
LGSDDFAAKLLGKSWQPRSRKTLDNLISEASRQFGLAPEKLMSSSRQRDLARARAWVAYQAITQRITTLSQVAALFGRTEAALRQSVKLHFNYP